MREDFAGLGGNPAEDDGVADLSPVLSDEIPRPLLDSSPADLIAASSSFFVGSWMGEGGPLLCGAALRPQNEAVVLAAATLSFVFSLSASEG